MGQFLSKRHQNHPHHHNNHHHHHHHHQQQQQQQQLPAPPPPPPPPPQQHQPPTDSASSPPQQQLLATYTFVGNGPPYPSPVPQPQPFPQTYTHYNHNYSYNYRPSGNMMVGPRHSGNNYVPPPHPPPPQYFGGNGWGQMQPPALPFLAPVPYVDHQSAKKIKNDVNVHKDTIRLEVDEGSRDCHLVSFVFDALVDGSITIFYFAKEGSRCTFSPAYPEMYVPVKIPFQKGLSQRFCQPSGSGIDLGFFDMDDLSKPCDGDVFPLVISAESNSQAALPIGLLNEEVEDTFSHAQISQAVIEKNNDDNYHVKVIKQILWIDEVRYELREIFGISNEDEVATNDKDSGKECVICMTEPKDTAVLPCRHMCMCSDCAKELRLQSNKCPICRQPIEELLEIRVDEDVS